MTGMVARTRRTTYASKAIPARSAALDVPEHRLAVEHAGETAAIAGERDRLAERNVGHVLERLRLDVHRQLLLCVEVLGLEPGRAQLLDLRARRPTEARRLAVAAQPGVRGRIHL